MNPSSLPVPQRIALLVKALDGAEKTNRALANCADADAMVEILLGASAKLGLGLTRRDLTETPPIRDWIWFKNNDPLITVGDDKPRYRREQPSDQAPRRRFLGGSSEPDRSLFAVHNQNVLRLISCHPCVSATGSSAMFTAATGP